MTNKEVHKIVEREFNSFFKEHGFVKYGSRCWVRSANEMIHMICLNFSYGQEYFDFDVAVQPWCVPEEDIYLNISKRLKMFDERSDVRNWGSYDEDMLNNDIKDAEYVFEKQVFPQLEGLADCLSLIEAVDRKVDKRVFTIDPYKKSRLWAYIYFYKHKFVEADEWVQQYKRLHNGFESERNEYDKARLRTLCKLFSRNDIEAIDKFFADIIENNRQNFKLDKNK